MLMRDLLSFLWPLHTRIVKVRLKKSFGGYFFTYYTLTLAMVFLLQAEDYFPAVQTTVSGFVVCLSPLLLSYVRHLPLDVFSTPQQQTSYEPVKSEIVTRGNDMFSALCVYSVPPSLPYSLCCCTYISYTSALCFF